MRSRGHQLHAGQTATIILQLPLCCSQWDCCLSFGREECLNDTDCFLSTNLASWVDSLWQHDPSSPHLSSSRSTLRSTTVTRLFSGGANASFLEAPLSELTAARTTSMCLLLLLRCYFIKRQSYSFQPPSSTSSANGTTCSTYSATASCFYVIKTLGGIAGSISSAGSRFQLPQLAIVWRCLGIAGSRRLPVSRLARVAYCRVQTFDVCFCDFKCSLARMILYQWVKIAARWDTAFL